MITPERPPLERQRYWQGQSLLSGDLNLQLGCEAQLRWWHNRALHDAAGVAYGFEVDDPPPTPSMANGRLRVAVNSGLAFDCHGREAVLAERTIVPAPRADRDASWTLLARVQGPRGAAFGRPAADGFGSPRAELHWVESSHVAATDGVPIARGVVTALPPGPGDTATPYFAWSEDFGATPSRPLARPRIHSGATIVGKTAWRAWDGDILILDAKTPIAIDTILVTVDATAAGFTKGPCYFAWQATGEAPLRNELERPCWGRIVESTATGFVYAVSSPRIQRRSTRPSVRASRGPLQLLALLASVLAEPLTDWAQRRRLSVSWLGLEMQAERQDSGKDDHVSD